MKALTTAAAVIHIIIATQSLSHAQSVSNVLRVYNKDQNPSIALLLRKYDEAFPAKVSRCNSDSAAVTLYVSEMLSVREASENLVLHLFRGKGNSQIYCSLNDVKAVDLSNFVNWVYGPGQNVLKQQEFFPLQKEDISKEKSRLITAASTRPSCDGLSDLNAKRKSQTINQ